MDASTISMNRVSDSPHLCGKNLEIRLKISLCFRQGLKFVESVLVSWGEVAIFGGLSFIIFFHKKTTWTIGPASGEGKNSEAPAFQRCPGERPATEIFPEMAQSLTSWWFQPI